VTDREMNVKREDQILRIQFRPNTIVRRDKDETELTVRALKVGQSVVVDAEGDSERKLDAVEIRIVPPIRSKPAR
jgi:hypothetical protein